MKCAKTNKLSTNYDANIYKVIRREGGEVTVKGKDSTEVKRNVNFVKRHQEEPKGDEDHTSHEGPTEEEEEVQTPIPGGSKISETAKTSRSETKSSKEGLEKRRPTRQIN